MGIKTENKKIQTYRQVIISCTCDNCNKTIDIEDDEIPDNWYQFNWYHTSWWNDSVESTEYYLSCSFDCYIENLKKAIIEFEEYDSSIIDNKPICFLKDKFK